ncbi:hypothetical protein P170DRAFT_471531 [Aspergillus steynii IBT 23096]|uniref:Uncharacterized protein n=1 Tax=Aspergillus steynii IBT 23096 TaxID=1392250 RepID=A0A2I2GFD9_9EURO|nr:uncharacterized protein P170DRAFT_471531 [Aspergillus steynii IBT 23096]PLB51598.1 hypothetical protein P170DRAFT_471531 [Aspergillus steynii IBT 23096]
MSYDLPQPSCDSGNFASFFDNCNKHPVNYILPENYERKDTHPFIAGGFVWTGWDYLGEPYHHTQARSSSSDALAMVRARDSGILTVRAGSEDLGSSTLTVEALSESSHIPV